MANLSVRPPAPDKRGAADCAVRRQGNNVSKKWLLYRNGKGSARRLPRMELYISCDMASHCLRQLFNMCMHTVFVHVLQYHSRVHVRAADELDSEDPARNAAGVIDELDEEVQRSSSSSSSIA